MRSLFSSISSVGKGLASLLLPSSCPRCGRRIEGEPLPCPGCDSELADLWDALAGAPEVADLSASFPFLGAARDLIHRMKYQGNRPAARLLGSLMAARLRIDIPDARGAVVVPVPLHPTRFRERGFNQAERLARSAAHGAGCELRANVLIRARGSVSQTTLDVEKRRASVAGAFRVRERPPDRVIILVDDVWTTGSTAEACRGALLEAGARAPIRVLVAARTLPRTWATAARGRAPRDPKSLGADSMD